MGTTRMKICLTGGPSAGKSTIVDIIQKEFSDSAIAVPEIASILYRGGFPRSSDPELIMSAQRAIYRTQIEFEKAFEKKESPGFIICDRGTLDQTAYWPMGADDFFKAVDSSLEKEISRYDVVLHLHTSVYGYNVIDGIRTENLSQALELDRRIYDAWSDHPRRIEVPSQLSFQEKIGMVFLEFSKLGLPQKTRERRKSYEQHESTKPLSN